MGWRATLPKAFPLLPRVGNQGQASSLSAWGRPASVSNIWTLAPVRHKPSLNFESKPLPGTTRPAGRAAISLQHPAQEQAAYGQQRARRSQGKPQRQA